MYTIARIELLCELKSILSKAAVTAQQQEGFDMHFQLFIATIDAETSFKIDSPQAHYDECDTFIPRQGPQHIFQTAATPISPCLTISTGI